MNDITLKKMYDCTHIYNALIMNGIMSASANMPFNVTIWTVFRNISSLRTELGHANIVNYKLWQEPKTHTYLSSFYISRLNIYY